MTEITNTFTPAQERWIAALESGDYKQTTKVLENDEGFCCLGVACAISRTDVKRERSRRGDDNYRYDGLDGSLGKNVQTEICLAYTDGTSKDIGPCLSEMNDRGDDFKTIATLLRRRPDDYFTNFDTAPEPSK